MFSDPSPTSNNSSPKLFASLALLLLAVTGWVVTEMTIHRLGEELLTRVNLNWGLTGGLLFTHSLIIASLAVASLIAPKKIIQLSLPLILPLLAWISHTFDLWSVIISLIAAELLGIYLTSCRQNLSLFRRLKLYRITSNHLSFAIMALSLLSSLSLYQQLANQQQLIVQQINLRLIQPLSQTIVQSQTGQEFLKSWGTDLSYLWQNPTLKSQLKQLSQAQKQQISQQLEARWTAFISPVSDYLDEILVIGLAVIYYQLATLLRLLPVLLTELIFNLLKLLGIIRIKTVNLPVQLID